MYALSVSRNFIALHYLIGGDWGGENLVHAHAYKMEVVLEGLELDRHGFLVDIVDLDSNLDSIQEFYENRVLNDLPEFAGLNPSIENLARIIWDQLSRSLDTGNLLVLSVTVWEDDKAWARFRSNLS